MCTKGGKAGINTAHQVDQATHFCQSTAEASVRIHPEVIYSRYNVSNRD